MNLKEGWNKITYHFQNVYFKSLLLFMGEEISISFVTFLRLIIVFTLVIITLKEKLPLYTLYLVELNFYFIFLSFPFLKQIKESSLVVNINILELNESFICEFVRLFEFYLDKFFQMMNLFVLIF